MTATSTARATWRGARGRSSRTGGVGAGLVPPSGPGCRWCGGPGGLLVPLGRPRGCLARCTTSARPGRPPPTPTSTATARSRCSDPWPGRRRRPSASRCASWRSCCTPTTPPSASTRPTAGGWPCASTPTRTAARRTSPPSRRGSTPSPRRPTCGCPIRCARWTAGGTSPSTAPPGAGRCTSRWRPGSRATTWGSATRSRPSRSVRRWPRCTGTPRRSGSPTGRPCRSSTSRSSATRTSCSGCRCPRRMPGCSPRRSRSADGASPSSTPAPDRWSCTPTCTAATSSGTTAGWRSSTSTTPGWACPRSTSRSRRSTCAPVTGPSRRRCARGT